MCKSAITATTSASGTVPEQHDGTKAHEMTTGMYVSVMFTVSVVFSSQASFIPTMPDDMLAVAQQAMGQLQWYCE